MSDKSCLNYDSDTPHYNTDNDKESINSSLHSGESHIKRYIFNNTHTTAETEKCVDFWKSIKSNNLEPVKGNNKNTSTASHNVSENEPVRPEYMWYNAFQTMQKFGMDKAMYGAAACRFCKLEFEHEKLDSNREERMEIAKLNYWKNVKLQENSSDILTTSPYNTMEAASLEFGEATAPHLNSSDNIPACSCKFPCECNEIHYLTNNLDSNLSRVTFVEEESFNINEENSQATYIDCIGPKS